MLLVIVNDFYVGRPGRSVSPLKANPPLVVDADAVLAPAVATQCLELVARQGREVAERSGSFHTVKLEPGGPFKARKRLYTFPGSEVSGSLVAIADYHLTPQE
jgi:hypothetical protein